MRCKYYIKNGRCFLYNYWGDKNETKETQCKNCHSYNYTECPIYKHQENSGCFITTVTCEILGFPDQNPALNTLSCFINNVLQIDEKYEEILKFYDIIGPMIANYLRKEQSKELATIIYKHYIEPISKLIEVGDYDSAIMKYQTLTLWLVAYCSLYREYISLKDIDYSKFIRNKNNRGHGRIKKIPNFIKRRPKEDA